jgi:uncharacterized protein
MTKQRLSNAAARRIFLDRHALLETPQGEANSPALLALIERLGFVQLDSINTVARAHDLILFARKPRYRPDNLKRLYERDTGLFEHWTHDAAVIPLSYYPQWQMRRTRDAVRLQKQWRTDRRDGFEAQLQTVLDHIRDTGACRSTDVGQGEKRGSGGWWDWHPSKTALEYLWRSGALHVVGRENFQKRYDLTERALDPKIWAANTMPSKAQTIDWCCAGALDRLGFVCHLGRDRCLLGACHSCRGKGVVCKCPEGGRDRRNRNRRRRRHCQDISRTARDRPSYSSADSRPEPLARSKPV